MIKRRNLMLGATLSFISHSSASAENVGNRGKLAQNLMALEKDSWKYTAEKNLLWLRSYFAEDAILCFADASRYEKEEFLKILTDVKTEDVKVGEKWSLLQISPTVATLLYQVSYRNRMKNEATSLINSLSSSTYVRRNGKWLSILYQETPTK